HSSRKKKHVIQLAGCRESVYEVAAVSVVVGIDAGICGTGGREATALPGLKSSYSCCGGQLLEVYGDSHAFERSHLAVGVSPKPALDSNDPVKFLGHHAGNKA